MNHYAATCSVTPKKNSIHGTTQRKNNVAGIICNTSEYLLTAANYVPRGTIILFNLH